MIEGGDNFCLITVLLIFCNYWQEEETWEPNSQDRSCLSTESCRGNKPEMGKEEDKGGRGPYSIT